MKINSMQNTKVKTWLKLKEKKYRDQQQLFLVEGEHLLEEAYQAGILTAIITDQEEKNYLHYGITIFEVTSMIMHKLASVSSKVNVIGICKYSLSMELQGSRFIVLDGVQDPGNIGTIIRSAYAFGYDGILATNDCADFYNEKVVRSTQGAMFHIPIYKFSIADIYKELKQRKIFIIATSLQKNSVLLQNIKVPDTFALVFGNEGKGISDITIQNCDTFLQIEMKQFESLNVAVAASICMYELNFK